MILHLSSIWMLILDFIAWLLINMSVAGVLSRLRHESFDPKTYLYKERTWEKRSKLYEYLFQNKKMEGLVARWS